MSDITDTMMLLPTLTLSDLNALVSIVSDTDASTPLKTELPSTVHTSTPPSTPRLSCAAPTTKKAKRLTLSPETRRRRRLDREKLRTQGVKNRIEQLRRDLAELTITRDKKARALGMHTSHSLYLEKYVALVDSAEQLYGLRQEQDDALERYQSHKMVLKLLAATGQKFRVAVESEPSHTTAIAGRAPESEWILMDPITLFESMLLSEPLSLREADALVGDSCREMNQSLAQRDWMYGLKEFGGGLSGGRRVEGTVLEFRLAKKLPSVTPRELMDKTWRLLTKLDEYRRIQPQTTQLRVLQRVSDTSYVVGIAVGTRHSLVLVGRVTVPGGCVVTFRSLPLVRKDAEASESARQHFVESETGGIHATTFSWYHFRKRPNAAGDGVDCDVVFGGTAHNVHPDYLNQLQLEVVAGLRLGQNWVVSSSNLIGGEIRMDGTGFTSRQLQCISHPIEQLAREGSVTGIYVCPRLPWSTATDLTS